MRGAIYSRVSTIDQDYNRQTNELKEYAKYMGIEITHVFEEKESGFNDDRPEFAKLKELTKDDIDIVLVWELSRLSRRSLYLQQQIEYFTKKGICFQLQIFMNWDKTIQTIIKIDFNNSVPISDYSNEYFSSSGMYPLRRVLGIVILSESLKYLPK